MFRIFLRLYGFNLIGEYDEEELSKDELLVEGEREKVRFLDILFALFLFLESFSLLMDGDKEDDRLNVLFLCRGNRLILEFKLIK